MDMNNIGEQFNKLSEITSKFEELSKKLEKFKTITPKNDTADRFEKIHSLKDKLNILNNTKGVNGEELSEAEKDYNNKLIKQLDNLESLFKTLEIK